MLRRAPGFALTAVLIVALGIGATTAAFSVTDFVLIRPLPFPEPERLVKLVERTPGYRGMELSRAELPRLEGGERQSFESMGMYHVDAVTMIGAGEPRRLDGTSVSADLFPTLGVAPIIGRPFTADGRPSRRAWNHHSQLPPLADRVRRRPGRHRSTATAKADFDDAPYTVIGVMPREFHFPTSDVAVLDRRRASASANYQVRSGPTTGWTRSAGSGAASRSSRREAELEVIAARLEQQYPRENKDTRRRRVLARRRSLAAIAPAAARAVGAAACVLLIACANLANLLLARALEPPPRAGGAHRDGRRPRAAGPAADDREPAAGRRRRRARRSRSPSPSVPLLARLVPATLPIAEHAVGRPARAARRGRADGAHRHRLRPGAGRSHRPAVRISTACARARERAAGRRSGCDRRSSSRRSIASVVLLVSAGLLIRALLTVQAIDPGFNAEGVLTLRTRAADAGVRPCRGARGLLLRVSCRTSARCPA